MSIILLGIPCQNQMSLKICLLELNPYMNLRSIVEYSLGSDSPPMDLIVFNALNFVILLPV